MCIVKEFERVRFDLFHTSLFGETIVRGETAMEVDGGSDRKSGIASLRASIRQAKELAQRHDGALFKEADELKSLVEDRQREILETSGALAKAVDRREACLGSRTLVKAIGALAALHPLLLSDLEYLNTSINAIKTCLAKFDDGSLQGEDYVTNMATRVLVLEAICAAISKGETEPHAFRLCVTKLVEQSERDALDKLAEAIAVYQSS